ncbi:MAG: histidine kinase [Eubacteriales bacterium]|nr:histidine kinase [Eubacteriales bacterium]
MKDLINKSLILIACCNILYQTALTPHTIIALTVSLSVSCLCICLEYSRIAVYGLGSYCLISIIFPPLGYFLPLLTYDILKTKQWLLFLPWTAGILYTIHSLPSMVCFPYIWVTIFCIMIQRYTIKLDTSIQKLHQTKDGSEDFSLALQKRNQALMEQQNSEIQIATLSERNRIAREIHDNAGHLLTRSLLQTGALEVINQESALEKPLSTLYDTLNTAMTSIRESVHDLHDESIHLESALRDLLVPIETPEMELIYDIHTAPHRDIKYCFIAITKEAINNIQKHSNATHAKIVLREHPGFYHLQIQDNGTNAVLPASDEDKGIGLLNMEERVQALHGNIHISIADGFCISITIMKGEHDESNNYR